MSPNYVYVILSGCTYEGLFLNEIVNNLRLAIEIGNKLAQEIRITENFPEPVGPWKKEGDCYTREKLDTKETIMVSKMEVKTKL